MMEFINSIEYARPVFLYAIPLSLALIWLLFWLKPGLLNHTTFPIKNLTRQSVRHPAIAWFKKFASEQQNRTHHRQFILRSTGWSILIILLHLSLAQPYRLGARLPDPPQHRDIVFIVDNSISMVLEDYLIDGKPSSRMRMLQSVMQHFIKQLKGNRIGIIVYSEKVYTLVPLTSDYDLIKQQLNRLRPAVLTGRTSNPGNALLYTLNKYRAQAGERPTLILISDVNRPDRNIDPRVAAASLSQQKFRLHTIAIGAGSYAADNKALSSLVYHPTNFTLLKQIAGQGKGQFFSANRASNIKQALLTIQQAEKRQVQIEPQYIRLGLYQWPLLLLIILLSMAQLYQLNRRNA